MPTRIIGWSRATRTFHGIIKHSSVFAGKRRMKANTLKGIRTAMLAALIVFGGITALFIALGYATKPVTDLQSADVQAKQLLDSVGGTSKVCDEAVQIFKRFGVSKEIFLSPGELIDYPAVAALGTFHSIRPGHPPYLSVRVGSHRDGFFIEIADTNGPGKFPKTRHKLELVESQLFVHR